MFWDGNRRFDVWRAQLSLSLIDEIARERREGAPVFKRYIFNRHT